MSTAVWAGILGGTVASAFFMYAEYKKLTSPAFEREAERRVTIAAERAVMIHLGEVYGLDAARIATISSIARSSGL